MSVIGEEHHVEQILQKYSSQGELKGTGGFFPQDMPDQTEKFDLIFAARVIHIGGLDMMKKHLMAMFAILNPGGKVIIETT